MIEKIEGIVIDKIRHNDTHNVVTLYTLTRGRMAFLSPVGKSKSGRTRNATLSLMSVVGASVNIRGDRELHTLRNPEPLRLWHGIYASPVKSSLIFFLAEFSNRLLRQYPADEKLWSFINGSLEHLDVMSEAEVANFHLAFLIGLLPLAGISPAVSSWKPGDRFDMLSGEMVTDNHPMFLQRRRLLSESQSSMVPKLLRMNFSNMRRFRFSRTGRQELLDHILDYYACHLPLSREFKSLTVLREMFS